MLTNLLWSPCSSHSCLSICSLFNTSLSFLFKMIMLKSMPTPYVHQSPNANIIFRSISPLLWAFPKKKIQIFLLFFSHPLTSMSKVAGLALLIFLLMSTLVTWTHLFSRFIFLINSWFLLPLLICLSFILDLGLASSIIYSSNRLVPPLDNSPYNYFLSSLWTLWSCVLHFFRIISLSISDSFNKNGHHLILFFLHFYNSDHYCCRIIKVLQDDDIPTKLNLFMIYIINYCRMSFSHPFKSFETSLLSLMFETNIHCSSFFSSSSYFCRCFVWL